MFGPCAPDLGGARERILSAQNLARPPASARHHNGDGFTTLVHFVPAPRRLVLKLLRRGVSRIESHISPPLSRPGFVETTKVRIPQVVNSRLLTRGYDLRLMARENN
jgi:hypothetical protein